jgi:hypothetical protein
MAHPREYRMSDSEFEVQKLLRKYLRGYEKQGWSLYINKTKPSYNTGYPIFAAFLTSPEGVKIEVRHDGKNWVYPDDPPHEGTVSSGLSKGGKKVYISEQDFLRNPGKIFAIFEEQGGRMASSDRNALIRLASSLPKGSDERKAILAGLAKTKTGSPLLTQLRLSDLDEYEVSPSGTMRFTKWQPILPSSPSSFRTRDHMDVMFPNGESHTYARRSTYPGSVFYLSTDEKYFIVVSRGQAFISTRDGVWNSMLADLSAKESKSFRAVAQDYQEDVELGWEPSWIPLKTVR